MLYQAIDAFRQAKKLERSLSDSEDAVNSQTAELRRDLQQARVSAGTNPSDLFTREQRLDEQLLRQAQQETRRDAELVFLLLAFSLDLLSRYLTICTWNVSTPPLNRARESETKRVTTPPLHGGGREPC